MVIKAERQRMSDFVVERLEESGLYLIVSADETAVDVEESREHFPGEPRQFQVLIHPYTDETIKDFKQRRRTNNRDGIHTANVFYGDGETYLKEVHVSKKMIKGALKSMSPTDIANLVKLTEIERLAYIYQNFPNLDPDTPSNALTYFMPEADTLQVCGMRPAVSNYKDKGPDFPEQKGLKNRKIKEVLQTISEDPSMNPDIMLRAGLRGDNWYNATLIGIEDKN